MASYARPAVLVVLLALAIQPAGAQSFLESLFGSDEVSPSRPASGYVRTRPASSLFDGLFSPSEYDTPPPHVRATTYRTLCVRMCDGFYFPISHATSSTNFSRDAEKCSASCGGDARLFYYPNSGGDIEGMLDMTGRAYASYPVAFKYRKTLVQGCQCRPQPWTEAELARHRAYASARTPESQYSIPIADAQTGPLAVPPVINRNGFEVSTPRAPGSYSAFDTPPVNPGFSTQEDLRAVARPTPVQRQPQAVQWEWFSDTGPTGHARSSRYGRPATR
jgi:uncharacterized protein DUF2865